MQQIAISDQNLKPQESKQSHCSRLILIITTMTPPTYLEAETQRSVGIPRAGAKVHCTTTKTTKVYIHQENVLNRVAATSAAASPSILYPKKTLPTTSNV